MSQEGILQKILEKFFGSSLQMIDFLSQFEFLVKKHFEIDKVYDLNGFCLVKRKFSTNGEDEVLQFLDSKFDLIEEVTLRNRVSEQLILNEFLSFGEEEENAGQVPISPLMRDFFDRTLAINNPDSSFRKNSILPRILLEEDRKSDQYNERPDIPLFEESEDGYQKVHPVSKAFEAEEEISFKPPFSEEPDLFSEIGLHPEKEEEPEAREVVPHQEEVEFVFTHSSIVVSEFDDEDEEEFTVFDGGMKVAPVESEPEIATETSENDMIESFIESLVDQEEFGSTALTDDSDAVSDETPLEIEPLEEEIPEIESIEEPIEIESINEDLPEIDSVEEPIEIELLEDVFPEIEPIEEPIDSEPVAEEVLSEEVMEEVEFSESDDDSDSTIAQEEESAVSPKIENEPLEMTPDIPVRKQRISIFDDIEEEIETVENINSEEIELSTEPIIENPVEEEVDSSFELIVSSHGDTEEAPEEKSDESVETELSVETIDIQELDAAAKENEIPNSIEVSEPLPAVIENEEETDSVEFLDTEPVEEPVAIEEPEVVEEPDAIEEPEVVEEPVAVEEPVLVDDPEVIEEPVLIDDPEVVEEPDIPVVLEEEVKADNSENILFDESFFDDVLEAKVEESVEVEEPALEAPSGSIESDEKVEIPVFHHIGADEPTADYVDEPVQNGDEFNYQPPENIVEEPIEMKNENRSNESEPEESRGTFSVLIKMLIVLIVIIATYFILSASGFLKGKSANISEANLAQGALIISDSSSIVDKREYPFNRDTQNDLNVTGVSVKSGQYYEVAENGILNPISYDTSKVLNYKVTVPPDSMLGKKEVKEKKGDKSKDKKEKDSGKKTEPGNIALQDAVKNKVKETKLADYVFKSGKKYFVQVSAHRSFDTAEKLAKELNKKGYKAFIMKIKKDGVEGENGVWYRVRVGPYDKEGKAMEINTALNTKKKK